MNKYVVLGLKVFSGLIALYLIATWSRWFIQPGVMLDRLDVSATSVFGLNMLKSDMGGFVLTIGILILVAIWKGGAWYSSALVAMSAILGTRLMSAVQDGGATAIWYAVVIEGVALAVMVLLFSE